MQPSFWSPPVELSEQEEQIVERMRRAKLFVFLRHYRHELLDEEFQSVEDSDMRHGRKSRSARRQIQGAGAPLTLCRGS